MTRFEIKKPGIFKSRFTLKIILLTILPIILISLFSVSTIFQKINELNKNVSTISSETLHSTYAEMITDKNKDIKDKVMLRLDGVLNELNSLRAGSQKLIDHNGSFTSEKGFDSFSWVNKHMVYNKKKNWSNLSKNEFDVSISVWGYLHNKDGSIKQNTRNYISLMSPIMPLMQTVGKNGVKKGWFYVIGPKETPVMIMTPWAQMPEIFDRAYPGHNQHNWWDFFFPGIVESWQGWASGINGVSKNPRDQVTLTPLYEDAGGTGLMVTMFSPLWNKDRTKNFGAAAVDYNLDDITKMIQNEHVGKTGFTFIVQNNGDILDATKDTTKKLELVQNKSLNSGVTVSYFNLKKSKIDALVKLADQFNDDGSSRIVKFANNQGEKYLLVYDKLMDYNLWDNHKILRDKLFIVSIIPDSEISVIQNNIHKEITRLSNETLLFLVGFFLLFALISIICSLWFALQNTRQIRLLSQGLTQVGKKRYNASIDVISKDELGNLAETFNDMTGEISKAYSKLEHYALDLEEKVKERTIYLEEANSRLQQLSQIDGLTKIYNRRHFDIEVDKTWRAYLRLKHPISIIMIDIDYFKKFNDNYGHPEGDKCLCSVASTLKNQLNRSSDIVARYGGEEFIVVACIDKDAALKLADKMRLAIRALSIEHQLSEKKIVTISLGVATTIPTLDKDIAKLIKAADNALYKSKQKGRDAVSTGEYGNEGN